MNKNKIIKVIDKKIKECKKCWAIGFFNHSIEIMAINTSMIENLIEIKRDCGFITQSEYIQDIYEFARFRQEIYDSIPALTLEDIE